MKIDLAEQYQLFLNRMGLDETKMSPLQKKQIKQTFMFAWGQCILIIRDVLGSNDVSEDQGVESLQDQINQVMEYALSLQGGQS